jgi:hypothetical protein
MMKAIPFIYAIIVSTALLVLLGLAIIRTTERKGELAGANSQLTTAQAAFAQAEQASRSMEDEQRRNRTLYTPEQAVQASFAVQAAKAAYTVKQTDLQVAQANTEDCRKRYENTALWILPLSVLLLIHILGALMLRPRRKTPLRVR